MIVQLVQHYVVQCCVQLYTVDAMLSTAAPLISYLVSIEHVGGLDLYVQRAGVQWQPHRVPARPSVKAANDPALAVVLLRAPEA